MSALRWLPMLCTLLVLSYLSGHVTSSPLLSSENPFALSGSNASLAFLLPVQIRSHTPLPEQGPEEDTAQDETYGEESSDKRNLLRVRVGEGTLNSHLRSPAPHTHTQAAHAQAIKPMSGMCGSSMGCGGSGGFAFMFPSAQIRSVQHSLHPALQRQPVTSASGWQVSSNHVKTNQRVMFAPIIGLRGGSDVAMGSGVAVATGRPPAGRPGRSPRAGGGDSPAERKKQLAFMAAVGSAAVAFGTAGVLRSQKEEAAIKELFNNRTDISELQDMVSRGEPLPELALVCGTLRADGRLPQREGVAVEQLLLTRFSPSAVWKEREEEIRAPGARGEMARSSQTPTGRGQHEHSAIVAELTKPSPNEIEVSRYSKPDGTVVRRLKVLQRKEKMTRYTVATARAEAPGLYLRGGCGGEAWVTIPPVSKDLGLNTPTLYLTVADVIQEFFSSKQLKEKIGIDFSQSSLGQTGSKFKHMSRFITRDTEPHGDVPRAFLEDAARRMASMTPARPGWMWIPEGFYDSPHDQQLSYTREELVQPEDFMIRAAKAGMENNQLSTYQTPEVDLAMLRDQEYGFRLVELRIPLDTQVGVLCKPQVAYGRQQDPSSREDDPSSTAAISTGKARVLELVEPPAEVMDGLKFRFRILQGCSVEQLLAHRTQNKAAYQALAAAGSVLIAAAGAGVLYY